MYDRILVALEGLAADDVAVDHATVLAKHESARVTLLRVVTPAYGMEDGAKHLLMEEGSHWWHVKQQAEANLTALQTSMESRDVPTEKNLIVGDRVEADEIIDFAAQGNFDLIVIAADDRSWWDRERRGSVADGVYRKSTIPTLFVSSGVRRVHIAPQHHSEKDVLAGFGQFDG
ncbi:MAG: universal stress protein [Rudaea sp.]